MNITTVFGPPGSGKTTYLLSIVETELANNVHPMKIGYFAFTKKAATEARDETWSICILAVLGAVVVWVLDGRGG